MAIELGNLTATVSRLMEQLESEFADGRAEVLDVSLIAEVESDEGARSVRVVHREGMRPHARLGLLEEGVLLATTTKLGRWARAAIRQREERKEGEA